MVCQETVQQQPRFDPELDRIPVVLPKKCPQRSHWEVGGLGCSSGSVPPCSKCTLRQEDALYAHSNTLGSNSALVVARRQMCCNKRKVGLAAAPVESCHVSNALSNRKKRHAYDSTLEICSKSVLVVARRHRIKQASVQLLNLLEQESCAHIHASMTTDVLCE
jgi:hypothetical protein